MTLNLMNAARLSIAALIYLISLFEVAQAAVRIGCQNQNGSDMRTWVSADIHNDGELRSINYRTTSKTGLQIDNIRIKYSAMDKDLSDKKSTFFSLTRDQGNFEPQVLILPKSFPKQKSSFKGSLVQLIDGWGSLDNVTTPLICRRLPDPAG